MPQLRYVGPAGRSFTDPPLGQLEPGVVLDVDADIAARLSAADFELARADRPKTPAKEVNAPTEQP